jgi:hypothetical protein
MVQGLKLLGCAAMAYCAPFVLWMLWAAVVKAPLAFGLLFAFLIIGSVANALLMQRAANRRMAALRARRAAAPAEPFPPGAFRALRPIPVTHWHTAVGPYVRRPVWASLQGAAALRARTVTPGSRTDPGA